MNFTDLEGMNYQGGAPSIIDTVTGGDQKEYDSPFDLYEVILRVTYLYS